MAKKEINIFSVSILDLLSGALGAVIILYIIIPKLNQEEMDLLDEVKALQQQSQSIEQILQNLENSIPKEVFEEIEEQLNQLKKEIDNLQATIESLAGKVEELQRQLADCENNVEQLNEQISQLEQEVSELKNQLQDCNEQQAQLRKQNQQLSDQNSRLSQENQMLQEQNNRLTEDLESSQEKLEDCENELRDSNFMVVNIRWETQKHDVDLWVIDPNGNKYYWKEKEHLPYRGTLTLDDVDGPGLEVFKVLKAYTGQYKIYYHFFDAHENLTTLPEVEGEIFYNKGAKKLPTKTLTNPGKESQAVYVMTVTVATDGSFTFN